MLAMTPTLVPQQPWQMTTVILRMQPGAMTFDAARGYSILLLPTTAFSTYMDSWKWDGSSWQRLTAVTGISTRTRAGMAFDSGRRRAVVFGGRDAAGMLQADTWESTGVQWLPMNPTSGPTPSARYDHAMAYDRLRARTVLFGGYDLQGLRSDTWEWDGAAWQMRTPAVSPAARQGTALAYDEQRGRILLFGGHAAGVPGARADTWEWDGVSWSQRVPATTTPGGRWRHAMAHDAVRGRTVLFGGVDAHGSLLADTWEWVGGDWQRLLPLRSPSPQADHSMAFDSVRGLVVLAAGTGLVGPLSEAWEWDGAAWSPAGFQLAPSPRSHTTMAFDSIQGHTLLFGGSSGRGLEGDLWRWDGVAWTQLAGGPAARMNHAAVFDAARGRLVLFAGEAAGGPQNDTWEWDGVLWRQVAQTAQMAWRSKHAMAYDSQRNRVVMHGGQGFETSAYYGDTWEFDGVSWSWVGTPLHPRAGHSMAFDEVRGRTVMFGGINGATYRTDTLEWDGTVWMSRTGGPPGRIHAAMVYDAGQQRVVMAGGRGASTWLGDTWSWDGSQWSQQPTLPTARSAHGLSYDPIRNRLVSFGGEHVGGLYGETWERLPLAAAFTYGASCGSFPPMTLQPVSGSLPRIGATVEAGLSFVPTPVAFMAAGWSRTMWGSTALPLDLGAYGLAGCHLLHSADAVAMPLQFAAANAAVFRMGVPVASAIIGVELHLQAWAPSPGANAAGLALSNGLRWLIGL